MTILILSSGNRGFMGKENNKTKSNINFNKTKQLTLTGLLFALALVLSVVENTVPAMVIPVPGVKLGLSNIVVMFALFFVGKGQAFSLAILKAFFVFLVRGTVAAFLSLCGGIFSLVIMMLLLIIFKEKISYTVVSIFGSIFHNVGQFIAISIIYTSIGLWAYLPILIIAGVIAGIITATLLRIILPALKKLDLRCKCD